LEFVSEEKLLTAKDAKNRRKVQEGFSWRLCESCVQDFGFGALFFYLHAENLQFKI
jgi:hypothetical protein